MELPSLEDDELISQADLVLICPWVQVYCFLYIGVDFSLNVLRAQGGGFEYSVILLFPILPENEARSKLPNSIQDGILEN
jgi:hypothetical protein